MTREKVKSYNKTLKDVFKFIREDLRKKWLRMFWPLELYGLKKWIERDCGIYKEVLIDFLDEKGKEAREYWLNGGNMFELIESKMFHIQCEMEQTIKAINEFLANTKPFER